jgi:hypothetical protein
MEPRSLIWNAAWIGPGAHPREDLGVFAFRRTITLEQVVPCRVRLSADNRYKLYVNGEMVLFGPQRGDAQHWFYETIDLAPHLKQGENEIRALVWNFGRWAPMAQHTVRTGFTLEGLDNPALSTPGEWQVARVEGWDFEMMGPGVQDFYIDIGPGEIIDLSRIGKDMKWRKPHHISGAEERGALSGSVPWMLIPRSLPPMDYRIRKQQPLVRRGFKADGDNVEPADNSTLKPGQEICEGRPLLLDYQELLCAYPRLTFEGPLGATVVVAFSEGMWQDEGGKGHRDEVKGKHIKGYQDKIILGAESTVAEPLWWRTYRYVLIESDQPVVLRSIEAMETGYPLKEESSFEAQDERVKPLWEVAVRTAQRCAGETYFDCPYYEQLQYVGDTRIQALIGYYLGRDRALTRNAVETLGWSLLEDGITQSRYPSRQTQVIPPFSLWWVMMTLDQVLYDRVDRDRWQDAANNVVESWTLGRHDSRKFWNFGDWIPGWDWGVPPGGTDSPTTYLIRSLCALTDQVTIPWKGEAVSRQYQLDQRKQLEAFRFENGLLMMDGHECEPTEHAEALYRVCQLALQDEVRPWPEEALEKSKAARCTFYFQYYKHLAMAGADSNFDYLPQVRAWTEMIENGLTTFAETPEPTRSDCHAWSAHPILGFFQIVAGVTSIAPGWAKARIAPHPGSMKSFRARIAHPDGDLTVSFENDKLDIETPVPATLVWKGKTQEIGAGRFSA